MRKKLHTARHETARLHLLNIRLDEGEVPGVLATEGWLDSINRSSDQCGEIKLAHELSQRANEPLMILPVRVEYLGELPRDLGTYLDPIQYHVWKGEDDSSKLTRERVSAILSEKQLPAQSESSDAGMEQLFSVTEKKDAPS